MCYFKFYTNNQETVKVVTKQSLVHHPNRLHFWIIVQARIKTGVLSGFGTEKIFTHNTNCVTINSKNSQIT